MKIIIISIALLGLLAERCVAQMTDIEIAQSMMCKHPDSVPDLLNQLGVIANYKNGNTLTVVVEDRVNPYTISVYEPGRKNAKIIKVTVRYYRKDATHLKSYASYNIPKDDEIYTYERSMGSKRGHLKISARCIRLDKQLKQRKKESN